MPDLQRREDMTAMTSVGLLFRELPVGIRLKDSTTLRELFADVHTQMQKGIEHSCYPYVDINHRAGSEEAAYLLYQQDIRDMGGAEGMDIETTKVKRACDFIFVRVSLPLPTCRRPRAL